MKPCIASLSPVPCHFSSCSSPRSLIFSAFLRHVLIFSSSSSVTRSGSGCYMLCCSLTSLTYFGFPGVFDHRLASCLRCIFLNFSHKGHCGSAPPYNLLAALIFTSLYSLCGTLYSAPACNSGIGQQFVST